MVPFILFDMNIPKYLRKLTDQELLSEKKVQEGLIDRIDCFSTSNVKMLQHIEQEMLRRKLFDIQIDYLIKKYRR
jgi:hypothetical protein